MLAKCLFRRRDTPAPSATCTSNRGGIHRVSFNLGETFPYPSWAGKWPLLLLRVPKRDMAPTNEHPLRRKNLAWRIGCWSCIRRPTRVRAQARQTLGLRPDHPFPLPAGFFRDSSNSILLVRSAIISAPRADGLWPGRNSIPRPILLARSPNTWLRQPGAEKDSPVISLPYACTPGAPSTSNTKLPSPRTICVAAFPCSSARLRRGLGVGLPVTRVRSVLTV